MVMKIKIGQIIFLCFFKLIVFTNIDLLAMFIHCMPKYMAFNIHWNKTRWGLLQICILNFRDPSRIMNLNFENS
jgi:hypothetical protein